MWQSLAASTRSVAEGERMASTYSPEVLPMVTAWQSLAWRMVWSMMEGERGGVDDGRCEDDAAERRVIAYIRIFSSSWAVSPASYKMAVRMKRARCLAASSPPTTPKNGRAWKNVRGVVTYPPPPFKNMPPWLGR